MELKNRSFKYGKIVLAVRTHKTSVTVCAQSGRRLHGHARGRTCHCQTARSMQVDALLEHASHLIVHGI